MNAKHANWCLALLPASNFKLDRPPWISEESQASTIHDLIWVQSRYRELWSKLANPRISLLPRPRLVRHQLVRRRCAFLCLAPGPPLVRQIIGGEQVITSSSQFPRPEAKCRRCRGYQTQSGCPGCCGSTFILHNGVKRFAVFLAQNTCI